MDPAETVAYRPNVLASRHGTIKLRWPHNFGAYRLTDDDLACGSTLGSPKTQITLKPSGAIERMYCVDAGAPLLGAFVLKHWDARSGMKLSPAGGHFFLYPEHQEHRYMLSNGVYVFEDVFVDNRSHIAYYAITLTNDSEEEQCIATYAFCELAEDMNDPVEVRYDERTRTFVVHSKSDPRRARTVTSSRRPDSYEVSLDHAKSVMGLLPGPLSGKTEAPNGLPCAVMHFSTRLARSEDTRLVFTFALSAEGDEHARGSARRASALDPALELTQRHYHDVLERSVAITPNPEINRGVLWAKANMERVLLAPPSGWTFTNDPMRSTNAVARDAAWFCAGADYFRQEFAAACLQQFVDRQEQSGLIIEYYDMLSGKTEDFGLNVNDDTPLLIWSLWHHYQVTGDTAFLERVYPAVCKAARYLARQRNEQGLIWCTSRETGTRGIAGWRNVIQNYRISGASTEINSEAYAAFRCAAHMARAMGKSADHDEFEATARDLRSCVNRHLFNPGNGLYYLNIDVDGAPVSDITGDLVFPVLFGVAEPETAARIIRRLSESDFWTSGGMRTIPHDAINYTPEGANGCLGGVWNGLTFWFAKAAAEYLADFSEEALATGFENYARDPRRNNTVPGQFSEWLHGETLVNEGMPLSPWFPPRYIWAVIEGVLGLDISGPHPRLEPHLPAGWKWCGVRNLPYRGTPVAWIVARVPEPRVWSNQQFESSLPIETLAEDCSERVQCSGDAVRCIAVGDQARIVALVGNTSDRTVTTALRLRDAGGPWTIRAYDSLERRRLDEETVREHEIAGGVPIRLEPKGFRLVELHRENR